MNKMPETDADKASNFIMPKTLVFTLLLAVVGSLSGGGFYMGRQSAQLEVLDNYKKSNDARLTMDEAAIAAGNTSNNEVNTRLTRIETQLDFIIKSSPGNVRK
jgi:hypothetical protein